MPETTKILCRARLVALWVSQGADPAQAQAAALKVYPCHEA